MRSIFVALLLFSSLLYAQYEYTFILSNSVSTHPYFESGLYSGSVCNYSPCGVTLNGSVLGFDIRVSSGLINFKLECAWNNNTVSTALPSGCSIGTVNFLGDCSYSGYGSGSWSNCDVGFTGPATCNDNDCFCLNQSRTFPMSVSMTLNCNADVCLSPEPPSGICPPPSSSSASSSSSSSDASPSSSSEEENSSSSSDNYSSSSSSEEPSSSSSEDEDDSSSSEDNDSSSSSAGCYPTFAEAAAVYDDNIWQCARVGDIPNFTIDIHGCISGECTPRSSSSSASSSSGGGNGTCAFASKSFLKKESDIYDDWVYMGKETYGSKVVTSSSLKPGSKFFDALGRVYDKMKAKIQYYVRPDAIKRDARDVPMEFEVWGRIIKDEDGNDIRMFVKEDKRNGLRKDSSFYFDGYWEVFEFNDAIGETVFKAASGIKSISRYDDKERLKEYYWINAKGDTLDTHLYEWKNGRLIRMTANGVVRKYTYGRTLQDMVRVEPSDEGFNYHRGYNGTAGKIPEEGTPEYEIFSLNPYGPVHFGEMEEENLKNSYFAHKKKSDLQNVLGRLVIRNCLERKEGMPEALCVKFQESEVLKNDSTKKYGFPSGGGLPIYGESKADLYLTYRCECNEFGKYQPLFVGDITNAWIDVYQNFWKYDTTRGWYEVCWGASSLGITYSHEIEHIRNSRRRAATLNTHALKLSFNTKRECENNAKNQRGNLEKIWGIWFKNEQMHVNPGSPTYSGDRYPYACY